MICLTKLGMLDNVSWNSFLSGDICNEEKRQLVGRDKGNENLIKYQRLEDATQSYSKYDIPRSSIESLQGYIPLAGRVHRSQRRRQTCKPQPGRIQRGDSYSPVSCQRPQLAEKEHTTCHYPFIHTQMHAMNHLCRLELTRYPP